MKVQIRLFAVARQLAGAEVVNLEVSPPCTIGQLRRQLTEQIPALEPILPYVLFAIGSDYVKDDTPVPAGGEVACIPPVSGG